jgi:hypothetical protein
MPATNEFTASVIVTFKHTHVRMDLFQFPVSLRTPYRCSETISKPGDKEPSADGLIIALTWRYRRIYSTQNINTRSQGAVKAAF